jgi:hypothetical protein
MSHQLALVTEGIIQSKRLLEVAALGDWDAFFEIDEKRQSALRTLTLNVDDIQDEELLEMTNSMLELIELNQQLEAICRQERQVMMEQLQKFRHGHKAHKAYSS